MKKYELVKSDYKISPTGDKLFRIKACTSFNNIIAGDRGGFIQSIKNLSMGGNAWVSGNALIGDKDIVTIQQGKIRCRKLRVLGVIEEK